MATGVQLSGPLPPEQFTQGRWAQIFGANAGIVGDTDGSAFGITLPPASDVAEIGSPTIESICIVGGFPLIIPAGLTQSVTIPASTNPTIGRTDIIAARFDTAMFTTSPGPVRLFRHAGTEGSTALTGYDPSMPSPILFPLWAVTRKQGQSLNQATVRDLRARSAWTYLVPPNGLLPAFAPLGARATRDGIAYRRDVVGASVDWVQETIPREVLTGTGVATDGDDWDVMSAARLSREGVKRWANLIVNLAGDPVNPDPTVDGERRVARLAAADRPAASVPLAGSARNTAGQSRGALGRIDPDGWVVWYWASTTNRFPTGSTITLTGPWELNA